MSIGTMALIVVLGTTTMWFRRAFQIRIPANPYWFARFWGAGLVLGLLALMTGSGSAAGGWAAAFGGLFLYFLFTGSQKNQTTLSIGDAMPAFTAVDDDGEVFDSAALAGTPVLLKFFRGHW